ncbi:hypothetical protein ACIP2X_21550 [Streptomyces sp. NPDC089424]|uniref:hypothetical protein n=1 Tax=Streptomyces sp. NPDC089424 TaxID=3365917 RepID=UPI003807DAB3
MPGLRGASVMAVMGGVLVLTGCQESPDSGSAAVAPSAAPSLNASPVADTTASPAPTRSPATPATPTSPAAATPVPSRTSAATDTAASPTPAAPRPAPASDPGCHNLAATPEVKAAVTDAYRRGFPRFSHIQPVPQQFFYGRCGDVRYAATRFQATAGATLDELVSLQDEGSATKYFSTASTGAWTYVAGDSFPRGAGGCADIPQIPAALSETWGNC